MANSSLRVGRFWVTVRVNREMEEAVRAYVDARKDAGKEPVAADVRAIIERHVTFIDLRPAPKSQEATEE